MSAPAELPKILIAMQPDGTIAVTGPVHDKILCLGLLSWATSLLQNSKPAPLIQPATAIPSLSLVQGDNKK